MPRLSDKYIAGFLDADGCIYLQFSGSCSRPQLSVSWSQKSSKDEVLYGIQEALGGSISRVVVKGVNYSYLTLCGSSARKALGRISQHLVIKRHYAQLCLYHANKKVGDVKEFKAYMKEERQRKCLPLPNFPARKWMAGYLDGDGCFSVNFLNKNGGAHLVLHVAASHYDTEGLEIIQKAFGGSIHNMCSGRVRQYKLALNPSKARQILGYCAKHMIVKRDQAMFILGCAKMGHYQDGRRIKIALKQLKSQGHRLSESGSVTEQAIVGPT